MRGWRRKSFAFAATNSAVTREVSIISSGNSAYGRFDLPLLITETGPKTLCRKRPMPFERRDACKSPPEDGEACSRCPFR